MNKQIDWRKRKPTYSNSLAQFPSEAMEVEGPSPEGPLDALAPGLEQLTRHPYLYAMDCTHTESCTSLLEYTHTHSCPIMPHPFTIWEQYSYGAID